MQLTPQSAGAVDACEQLHRNHYTYHELSVEERSDIQIGLLRGMSRRAIARILNRSPSTINRKIRRNRDSQKEYHAQSPASAAVGPFCPHDSETAGCTSGDHLAET